MVIFHVWVFENAILSNLGYSQLGGIPQLGINSSHRNAPTILMVPFNDSHGYAYCSITIFMMSKLAPPAGLAPTHTLGQSAARANRERGGNICTA